MLFRSSYKILANLAPKFQSSQLRVCGEGNTIHVLHLAWRLSLWKFGRGHNIIVQSLQFWALSHVYNFLKVRVQNLEFHWPQVGSRIRTKLTLVCRILLTSVVNRHTFFQRFRDFLILRHETAAEVGCTTSPREIFGFWDK